MLTVAYARHTGLYFRLYGEALFIALMNVLITLLFIFYSEKNKIPYFAFYTGIKCLLRSSAAQASPRPWRSYSVSHF